MNLLRFFAALVILAALTVGAADSRVDANRLTYLDENSPFHPHLKFPKLTTPQWIGEPGVEAVVILSIDDMSSSAAYEVFLRPILDRLKKIDGRAPVSIFANSPNPQDPQLQAWLKEGLTIEAHTLHHPCPLLSRGDFAAATNTYHGCVDLLSHIPGNKPAAFRMPCCDSMNSPSPRFYFEIFDRTNAAGQFLTIDSSVMNITSTNDPALPRDLVLDADGKEKFRKYVPFPSFSTTIDDYPYPYQIGGTIWEFPCAVPSDWEAQNLHSTNNPITVRDWKASLDIAVIKKGVMTVVIHPHGWIKAEQMVELIDYATEKYGTKVKFLNFREAQERLNTNLLAGQPLRDAKGEDNGVRLLDLNNDRYMDVVIGNAGSKRMRIWNNDRKVWEDSDFPTTIGGVRFGVVQPNAQVIALLCNESQRSAWRLSDAKWIEDKSLLTGLVLNKEPVLTSSTNSPDHGVRFRDVDKDGSCELIIGNDRQNAVFSWQAEKKTWSPLPFALPQGTSIVSRNGHDNGFRFVDVNEDGFADVLFSNEEKFSLHLFVPTAHLGFERGWTMQVRGGKRGDANEIPMISRGGDFPNNGAWFRNRHLWVQNENTADKPDVVDRRSFAQLLSLDAPPPKSPAEALASMKVPPGFKVELVAAEPLVEDPIAFEWGADGKLWVVEMGDYPLGVDGKGKGGGKIRVLEDKNGDGRYDSSTIFLNELEFPTGVMPWGKGVLVCAAPEIFYAADTNGDGMGDMRRVLFTGFHPGNQQHRVNGFSYGLDNWIYGANGDSGGEITSALTGKKVNINGRDFRFRPDTGEFETESGQTQFGRHRDDWGNWFGNNNPTWAWHYVYPERYLIRNPHLPVSETRHMLAGYPDSTRVFPASRTIERFNWAGAANHVTSANSPTPYRDDLFGADFSSSLFISEPVHNCVHREVLKPDGVTFTSGRAPGEADKEFLASTDNWFRPTMLKTGPDGALYVADMYRLVIEHPEWIPAERQKQIDLRAGADKGRIYSIAPDKAVLRPIPNLSSMSTVELVAALDSVNGWQRDTAQRLLVERQDASAVAPVKELFAKSANPKTRVHALCTLEGLAALDPGTLTAGFKDGSPRVREHAVRLAEPHGDYICSQLKSAGGFEPFARLARDPDARVRFQFAFTLGQWKHVEAGELLAELALNDFENGHLQTAILSSAVPHVRTLLTAVFRTAHQQPPPAKLVEQLMSLATAMNDEQLFAATFQNIAQQPFQGWQFAALAGFLDELDRKNRTLAEFCEGAGPDLKKAVDGLQPLFAQAQREATADGVLTDGRWQTAEMIRLLGRGLFSEDKDLHVLARFLQARALPQLQKAALANIARARGEAPAALLVSQWNNTSPALRDGILNVLLSRPTWTHLLLAGIESAAFPPSQIGVAHQQKLLTHADVSIKTRASKLFVANVDRQKVIKQFEGIADLTANPSHGRELFMQNCAPCHRFKDLGNQIGPDLGMMADKPIPVWLTAILDPNQAVESRYVTYTAVLADDREITGIVATETANSVRLKNASAAEETVLRTDLRQLKSSGLSLMPEGFENSLKPQDMADLIAYLTSK